MKKYVLLAASGKDRPGIVAAVTKVVFELQGNIEDATMTRLGGEFTMMLVVALPGSQIPSQLSRTLRPYEKKLGLHFNVQPLTPAQARNPKRIEPRFLISVYGTDKPGIVHHVAQTLADHGVSITDLNTRVLQRRGAPVYVMLLEIQIRDKTDMDDIRSELDTLRQKLDVEISLQDLDAVPL
jgi:glycine cleavage system transcriptional repressor